MLLSMKSTNVELLYFRQHTHTSFPYYLMRTAYKNVHVLYIYSFTIADVFIQSNLQMKTCKWRGALKWDCLNK